MTHSEPSYQKQPRFVSLVEKYPQVSTITTSILKVSTKVSTKYPQVEEEKGYIRPQQGDVLFV